MSSVKKEISEVRKRKYKNLGMRIDNPSTIKYNKFSVKSPKPHQLNSINAQTTKFDRAPIFYLTSPKPQYPFQPSKKFKKQNKIMTDNLHPSVYNLLKRFLL